MATKKCTKLYNAGAEPLLSTAMFFCDVLVAIVSMGLRTVLYFATAHTFCAYPNGPRSSDFLRAAPTNLKGFFARFITMRERKILGRSFEIKKENWW